MPTCDYISKIKTWFEQSSLENSESEKDKKDQRCIQDRLVQRQLSYRSRFVSNNIDMTKDWLDVVREFYTQVFIINGRGNFVNSNKREIHIADVVVTTDELVAFAFWAVMRKTDSRNVSLNVDDIAAYASKLESIISKQKSASVRFSSLAMNHLLEEKSNVYDIIERNEKTNSIVFKIKPEVDLNELFNYYIKETDKIVLKAVHDEEAVKIFNLRSL